MSGDDAEEPTLRARAGAAWSAAHASWVGGVRGTIASARAALGSAERSLSSTEGWAEELHAAASTHVLAARARAWEASAKAVEEYPEGVAVGATLFLCNWLGAANNSLLGRSPVKALAGAACCCWALRAQLHAKWGDVTSPPLTRALEQHAAVRTEQGAALRSTIASTRAEGSRVSAAVCSAAARTAEVGNGWIAWADDAVMSQRRLFSTTATSAKADYPEFVVGAGALFAANFIGAGNNTLLGRAPRRVFFAGALVAWVMRAELAAKYGDALLSRSERLSGALRGLSMRVGVLRPAESAEAGGEQGAPSADQEARGGSA